MYLCVAAHLVEDGVDDLLRARSLPYPPRVPHRNERRRLLRAAVRRYYAEARPAFAPPKAVVHVGDVYIHIDVHLYIVHGIGTFVLSLPRCNVRSPLIIIARALIAMVVSRRAATVNVEDDVGGGGVRRRHIERDSSGLCIASRVVYMWSRTYHTSIVCIRRPRDEDIYCASVSAMGIGFQSSSLPRQAVHI